MIPRFFLFITVVFVFGCEQSVQVDTRSGVEVAWVEIDMLRLDSALQMIDRTIAANAITVRVINFTDKEILDTCQDGCMQGWLNLSFSNDSSEKYLFTDCERCEIRTAVNDTTYLTFSSEKLSRHIKGSKLDYKRIDWANSFIEMQMFDSTYHCGQSQNFNLCIDTTYDPKISNNCIKYHGEAKVQSNKFRW